MKKILVIAYHFPPLGGIPVKRTIRLVKYLREYDITILTSENGYDFIHGEDRKLLEIFKNNKIIRVKDIASDVLKKIYNMENSIIKRILMYIINRIVPDEKIFWGIKFILNYKSYNIKDNDLIYCTGYPWTSYLIGKFLKKSTNCHLC